ncbi:MAG: SDR family NAD(P)-dependent oxidoreductase [Melioribacter sp.]|nr:SDR family NAD(P)-dependent oxidoreductase [Melioribacter sp.]
MDLSGKTILITGASSGIGRAIASKLSGENVNLILTARRINLLEEIKEEDKTKKCSYLLLQCNVSNKNDVAAAYTEIKDKFGSVDLAILNAGAGHYMNVRNYNSQFAEKIYGTNLLGMIYWIEQFLPDFLERKNGIIAGVSSLADNRGYSGSSFYTSSKAAITNYLEGLRVELNPYGVKVITIRPGFVETPMTSGNKFKMPFLITAEKTADIIIDGIKKEKRVIQFPWQMVLLTSIVGMLPGWLYELLAKQQHKK